MPVPQSMPARVAALLVLCAAAPAPAQTPPPPSAADPAAPVPPTVYRSSLAYRVEAPPDTRPDRHWREANAIVAAGDGMAMGMPSMHGASTGRQAHDGHAPAAAAPIAPHEHPMPAPAGPMPSHDRAMPASTPRHDHAMPAAAPRHDPAAPAPAPAPMSGRVHPMPSREGA